MHRNFLKTSNVTDWSELHCRGYAKGLMDAIEVVEHEAQGHRTGQILARYEGR